MSEFVLLNNRDHAHMGWKPLGSFQFAAPLSMVPVALPEITALLPVYPLALFRGARSARLQLVALTGLETGHNLFVAPDGRWVAPYVPQSVQLYPFALHANAQGSQAVSLGFVVASGAWREHPQEDAGECRFFQDDGKPSPALQAKITELQASMRAQHWTNQAIDALEEHGLLEPWPGAQPEGATSPQVDTNVGLFRVNEARLNSLSGDALKALQQANALVLAYAQLLSMGRMEVLQRLSALHARQAAQPATAAAPAAPDPAVVQRLFEPGQPDTIQFNW